MKKQKLTLNEEISQMKRMMGKLLNEDTLPQKRITQPISHTKLQNITPTPSTIKTNQNILNQLQTKKLIADPRQLNINVNDQNFLSKISQYLQNKGITPYLNVNTDQSGNSQSVNGGITFSVPKFGIDLSVERSYFGVSKELPFLNGVNITGSYTPGSTGDDYYGTGYKSVAKNNSSYTLNNKFNVGLTIPIGK